jgi:hypothetical protein
MKQRSDKHVEIGDTADVSEQAGYLERVIDIRLPIASFSFMSGVLLSGETGRPQE